MRVSICMLLLATLLTACRASQFTDDERAAIVSYWTAPGRYVVGLPALPPKAGPWKAGLTVEGSTWFLAYQRAVGAARIPPTQDAAAATPDTAAWEKWVQAKLDYDWAKARAEAAAANAAFLEGGSRKPAPVAPSQLPAPSGPIPAGLPEAAGNPPPFAAAVAPKQHTVTFHDGEVYTYVDNRLFDTRPRFAYYRHTDGVVVFQPLLRDMPAPELDSLFAGAGFTPAEQRIARAVSALEGGFESVNTYDTGSISIGFIQFVTMDDGRHSLLEVLAREKANDAAAYNADFRRFGLDATPDGTLVAVDPDTGAELVGSAAVRKVIADKRLTAVFQRAGRHSLPFRVAQIQVAKAHYWPADDPVSVTVDGQTLTGKVSDVVKSEAGIATLFDRKVNRGSIAPFADVLARVMAEHGAKSLADAVPFEREAIAACKYRADFLKNPALSQPK